jgi:hypothetical protein
MEEELVAGQDYRVLSIRPEWAWAVMYGGKTIEYRTWSTSHRGRILIHASGKGVPASRIAEVRREVAAEMRIPLSRVPEQFEVSAILGSVELVDCVVKSPEDVWWILRDVRPLSTPLRNIKGTLKVWHWTLERTAIGAKAEPLSRSARPAGDAPRKPESIAPEHPRRTAANNLETNAVLGVFRSVATVEGTEERDFLREVSRMLGFSRMGARVEAELKKQLRTAMKRRLLTREGHVVRAATQSLADYDVDTLVEIVSALVRRGKAMERRDLSLALLGHLGFATPANSNGELAAPALDAAVKSRVLTADGTKLRRAG